MWLLVLFLLLNVALALFGRHIIRFSAFEISPAAIAILAWHGDNIIVGSLVLTVAYACTSVYDLRYLWLTLPLTILVGYLSLGIHNLFVLIVLYHVIGGAINFFLQRLDTKYVMFILANVTVNFMVARIYGFLT